MADWILDRVVDRLIESGISAYLAYPGTAQTDIGEGCAAVSLEKMEYTTRSAVVLVSVMVPVSAGGAACQKLGIRVGGVLEAMGAVCVQEGCRFDGYADGYCVNVRGTFYGADVTEQWESAASFRVKLEDTELGNTVGFQAEQEVDAVTGEPLSSAVWIFRLEETFGRGEGPMPAPTEPFTITVLRSGSTDVYRECKWTAVALENTATGLRQIRQGVAKSRSFMVVG